MFFFQEWVWKGSPGSPVFKTLWFQCTRPGFEPWLGSWRPHAGQHSQNNFKEKEEWGEYVYTGDRIPVWQAFFLAHLLHSSTVPWLLLFWWEVGPLSNCPSFEQKLFSSGRFYYSLLVSFFLKFHRDVSRSRHTLTLWIVVFHQFQSLLSHTCTDSASEIFPPFSSPYS